MTVGLARWFAALPILFLSAGCSAGQTELTRSQDSVTVVKEIAVPSNYGEHDQFARGGLMFLCEWNTGLNIYDVGDGRAGGSITNPVKLGSIVTNGGEVHNAWWYWSPTGEKRYVFVGQEGPGSIGSSSSGDIHVVDISNASAPVEVAFYHMTNPAAGTHNFWVDEAREILYAAYYNGGVVALNISGALSGDLSNRELARVQPGRAGATYTWGVHLYNGSIYASDMVSGFFQLKLSGGVMGVVGGGFNVPERFTSDLWVANGYAYTGTWGSRTAPGNAVKIWKLDSTGAPALVDSIITRNIGTVSDIEVSADNRELMFSAENGVGAGIYFYSLVGHPDHPTLLGSFPMAANAKAGIHTASFYETGGHRYVLAARDPPLPSALILDVTQLNP